MPLLLCTFNTQRTECMRKKYKNREEKLQKVSHPSPQQVLVIQQRKGNKSETEKTKKCQRSYTAVFWRNDELGDLSSVDTEDVLHLTGENVPDDDGEVDASRHERALVVAGGDLVRIQDTRNLVPVTPQGTMGRPACTTEGHNDQYKRTSSE